LPRSRDPAALTGHAQSLRGKQPLEELGNTVGRGVCSQVVLVELTARILTTPSASSSVARHSKERAGHRATDTPAGTDRVQVRPDAERQIELGDEHGYFP
jgi:hypothetical protein